MKGEICIGEVVVKTMFEREQCLLPVSFLWKFFFYGIAKVREGKSDPCVFYEP